jgi:hypothetical protein
VEYLQARDRPSRILIGRRHWGLNIPLNIIPDTKQPIMLITVRLPTARQLLSLSMVRFTHRPRHIKPLSLLKCISRARPITQVRLIREFNRDSNLPTVRVSESMRLR